MDQCTEERPSDSEDWAAYLIGDVLCDGEDLRRDSPYLRKRLILIRFSDQFFQRELKSEFGVFRETNRI